MDLSAITGLLVPGLAALALIGEYFRRQARRERAELRRARRWMLEADLWMYHLEREGWSRRGRRPPPRPEMLRIQHDDPDPDDDQPDDRGAAAEGAEGPRRGARHAISEG